MEDKIFDDPCYDNDPPSEYQKEKKMVDMKVAWQYLVKIEKMGKKDDFIAHLPGGKVVFIQGKDLEIGRKYPISIHSEKEKFCFAIVTSHIIINGWYLYLPKDSSWEDMETLRLWAERAVVWQDAVARARKEENEKYEQKRVALKEKLGKLIDFSTFESTGRYMGRYKKLVDRQLTREECEYAIFVFGLPPWGVSDRGEWLHTDSYTD